MHVRAYRSVRLYVHCTGCRAALSAVGVRHILRRRSEQHDLEGPINPHAWRHAFAREYLRSGGDLSTLSDILGHKEIAVTASAYANFLPSELQVFHAKHGPLNGLGDDIEGN